jgi:hypothetical protein
MTSSVEFVAAPEAPVSPPTKKMKALWIVLPSR